MNLSEKSVQVISKTVYGEEPEVLWRLWWEQLLGITSTTSLLQTETPRKDEDKSAWEIASEHMGYYYYRQVVTKNATVLFNVAYEQLGTMILDTELTRMVGFVKPTKRQFTLQATTTRLLAAYCSTFVDCLTNAFFIFLK